MINTNYVKINYIVQRKFIIYTNRIIVNTTKFRRYQSSYDHDIRYTTNFAKSEI